jgi:predicted DNA-binding ribbon-helix-helix protein
MAFLRKWGYAEGTLEGRGRFLAGELRKRSVMIAGHATSVSLEGEFWDVLKEIADGRGVSLNQLVAEIDSTRTGNLSSAIRVFVLTELRKESPADR